MASSRIIEDIHEMETDLFKSSHDDEIPMEIGLNDEQAIIAELHSCRVNLQPGLPTSNDSQFCGLPVETSCVNYSDFLYIILDTNVLLSHLKFLIELKDHSLKDVGKPVLVIPWIVIQELDVLKSSSDGLGKQARIAGQFIHDSLTSHHPRVRGQTIEEVNTEVNNLSISNNDDRILHCCLVYQYKTKLQAEPGIVILFSNDTMLCAKAKINAIVSCSRKTLMSQLKSLTINRGPISYAQTHEFNYKVDQQLKKDDNYRLLDDCLCQAEENIRDSLTIIIEYEMKEAFGDISYYIMGRKPPWNLDDVIYLLDKHWVAVFQFTFADAKLKVKNLIDMLQGYVKRRQKQEQFQSSDISSFINCSIGLLQQFVRKSEIWSTISVSVASLKVLMDKIASISSPSQSVQTMQSNQVMMDVMTPQSLIPSLQSPTLQAESQSLNLSPVNPLDNFCWIFQLISRSIVDVIQTCQSNLVNEQNLELKLIEMLKLIEEILIPLESLLNEGLIQSVGLLRLSITNYLRTILNIDCPLNDSDLFNICQLDGINQTFNEARTILMDGRCQITHLLHEVTQSTL